MPTDDERRAALSALAGLSRFDLSMLDELFPSRPWSEVVPPDLWYRRDVLEERDEGARFQVYKGLASLLGPVHAATLMGYLPPVPWQVLARYGIHPPTRSAA